MKNLYLTILAFIFCFAANAQITLCVTGSVTSNTVVVAGAISSDNPGIATVEVATGVVTGVGAGVAHITTGTGSVTVTVYPTPAPIGGADAICNGYVTSLTEVTPGGAWSSSNTAVAIVNFSAMVTSVSAGTAIISYTTSGGCAMTHTITVEDMPMAGTISGGNSLCVGIPLTLSDNISGGSWSSGSTSTASIDATGTVYGVAAGTTTISYAVSNSCGSIYATQSVTVIAPPTTPGAITGGGTLCLGGNIYLTDATGGGVWSSSNTAIATADGIGTVHGIAAGAATVSYTVSNSCGSAFAALPVTVTAPPSALPAISGSGPVCAGNNIYLTDATTGGTWSTSNTAIATVGAGAVHGIAGGPVMVSYTVSNSCGSVYVTLPVTVNPLPDAGSISGPGSICGGTPIALSDGAAGGSWSSSNTGIATVSGGTVYAAGTGTATISYTVSNSCGTAMATHAVSVGASPSAGTITGPAGGCAGGGTFTLLDGTTGGVWSSSNTLVATITTVGLVTGVTAGNVTISYTVSNSCGTATATYPVMIQTLPAAGTITGVSSVCTGSTVALTDLAAGGIWSTSNTAVATIDGVGLAHGVSSGGITISYSVTNLCGSSYTTTALTVIALPVTPSAISGVTSICQGITSNLSDATASGAWSSSNTLVATISGGSVHGVAAGTATISYIISNSCGSAYTATTVTVTAPPAAPGAVAGGTSVCTGSTISLSDATTGGVWSSANTAIATVSNTGIAGGVTSGSAVISYAVTNACGSAYSTTTVTVTNTGAGSISGAYILCIGHSLTLTDPVTGGVWSSGNTNIAVVNASGIVTGINRGTAPISYTVSLSCGSFYATTNVNVSSQLFAYPDTIACTNIGFSLSTCAVSPSLNVISYFGDGTSANTMLSVSGGSASANISHLYGAPGAYSYKHILFNGTTRVDSMLGTISGEACTINLNLFWDDNNNGIWDPYPAYEFANSTQPIDIEIDSDGVYTKTVSCLAGLSYPTTAPLGTIYSFKPVHVPSWTGISTPVSGVITATVTSTGITYSARNFGLICGANNADLAIYGRIIAFDYAVSAGSTDVPYTYYEASAMVVNNGSCNYENPTVTITHPAVPPSWETLIGDYGYPIDGVFFYFAYSFDFGWIPAVSPQVLSNCWGWGPYSPTVPAGLPSHGENFIDVTNWGQSLLFLPLGSYTTTFHITPSASGDHDLSNNVSVVPFTVTGAYDPNDITVSPAGYIAAGTELQYIIHFENVGNDTAHNIHIMDTLSDNLVVDSLHMVASMGAVNISYLKDGAGHNVVKFDMPNINLLDTTHHGLNHGMIVFKISTKSGLPDGTLIPNHASVYFDYNAPVITDTVTDTIGTLGVALIAGQAPKVSVYPNPASNTLTLQMYKDAYNVFTITNELGQELMEQTISDIKTNVGIASLPAGMYYITLKGDNGTTTRKFVKM